MSQGDQKEPKVDPKANTNLSKINSGADFARSKIGSRADFAPESVFVSILVPTWSYLWDQNRAMLGNVDSKINFLRVQKAIKASSDFQ